MKFIQFIFIFFVIISCGNHPDHEKGISNENSRELEQPSINFENEKQVILGVLDKQAEAWNEGSLEGFMQGYDRSPDLLFFTSRGPRYGWDSVFTMYQTFYDTPEKMGTLSFDINAVKPIHSDGSLANVTGQWRLTKADTAQGWFSLIFNKKEEGWRIVVDHTW